MAGPRKFSEHYLKQNGIDAEEVKDGYGYGAEADIYNGDTVTFRDKSGNLLEDTGMSKAEFFEWFGEKEDEENE